MSELIISVPGFFCPTPVFFWVTRAFFFPPDCSLPVIRIEPPRTDAEACLGWGGRVARVTAGCGTGGGVDCGLGDMVGGGAVCAASCDGAAADDGT